MRALGFCVDVRHAELMAERFRQRGIEALAVSGETPAEERRGALPKAIAHLRTAITFEPKNVSFRQKLDRLEQQLKAAKSASK